MPDPAKTGTGGKTPPLLELPDDRRTSDRQASPVRLSAELTLKVQTQMNRITTVRKVGETLPSTPDDTSLDEVLQISIQLEEVHKAFLKEHAYFEVSWPAALIAHEYFSKNAFAVEAKECMTARRALAKLKGALAERIAPTTAPVAAQPSQSQQRLPDISIPSFKGVYEAWPTYRDLFKAVIYDSQRLTDVEKLHYLRLSLEGPPAQLISGLPLTGDSLKPSWEMLVDRYENKRLLIQSYLDQLFASSTPVQKNAKALDKLLNTFKEGIKGLQSLGVSQDLGDCVLVYQLSRQLDRQGAVGDIIGRRTRISAIRETRAISHLANTSTRDDRVNGQLRKLGRGCVNNPAILDGSSCGSPSGTHCCRKRLNGVSVRLLQRHALHGDVP
ncbi:uncharacterized protein LOC143902973 isoform X1 [Temnothorax americanus]|uniref:uncharacterized protein LOC143902973 isoform X1 n=1 Tax=Temnothorax americanus TaxID=1964332 RepID=UPI004067A272